MIGDWSVGSVLTRNSSRRMQTAEPERVHRCWHTRRLKLLCTNTQKLKVLAGGGVCLHLGFLWKLAGSNPLSGRCHVLCPRNHARWSCNKWLELREEQPENRIWAVDMDPQVRHVCSFFQALVHISGFNETPPTHPLTGRFDSSLDGWSFLGGSPSHLAFDRGGRGSQGPRSP